MTQSVHVVAVGARTPLGMTADSSIAALRAGITAFAEHPFLIDRTAEPVRMARDSQLEPGFTGPGRLIELLVTALEEVAVQLVRNSASLGPVPLFLALPEIRPGWSAEDVRALRDTIGQRALPVRFRPIEVRAGGHAAGLTALEVISAKLSKGGDAVYVIAGVDSYLNFETLAWLDERQQLANSYNRGAFFPGEGAGAFAVASGAAVTKYGLNSLAVIRGTGTSTEARLIKTDAVCLGEGLTACMRKAVAALRLPDEAIDGIICDINGERYRTEEWGFVLLRMPTAFGDPTRYDMPAACWGDMGAASGPLHVAIAVTANKRGYAKGSRYMIWNSSEGGLRAAAVMQFGNERGSYA